MLELLVHIVIWLSDKLLRLLLSTVSVTDCIRNNLFFVSFFEKLVDRNLKVLYYLSIKRQKAKEVIHLEEIERAACGCGRHRYNRKLHSDNRLANL